MLPCIPDVVVAVNRGHLVTGLMCAGPAEQSMEEEWQKLQEHPDILAAAPDDEVLAEMLALQVTC